VRIRFAGAGSRSVRMGYVIESPVWKTSYRLSLPSGAGGDGQLQGWALVENPTESDWTGVDLTLVSGRPVSFIQDLYTPRYVQRPVVQLPDDALVRPQTYETGARPEPTVGRLMARAAPPPPPAAAPAPADYAAEMEMDLSGGSGVVAQATAGDFGELFAYRLGDVTLPRRGSAMLPIVTDAVTAERLSIYSTGGAGRHPMRGVRLHNTTGKSLRGGPITVLDDGYAGDALLPDLPDGDERLLTFAVDQDVLVDPFALPSAAGTIETATLRDGVLMIRRQARESRGYRLENRGRRDRVVLVEHPRQSGASLVEPRATEESTPALYRFRVALAPGGVDTLRVVEARTTGERVVLVSENPDRLALLAQSDGALPDDIRRALRDAVARRQELAQTEAQLSALAEEVSEIERDQTRLRGNLEAVENSSDYGRRLLARLDEQETRLDQIRTERSRLETQAARQREALRVTVR
jgi:hypothetical protein